MAKITIELNNNTFKCSGELKVLNKLYEELKVRHPNAWYIKPYMPKGWDGKIEYMTKAGSVKTGLLPLVTSILERDEHSVDIVDYRKILEKVPIPTKIGEFIPREYQIEAVKSIVNNKVSGIPFQRGILAGDVNAGKTIMAGLLCGTFNKYKALILLNNKTLYNQFIQDMPKMFGDKWGYMQGKNIKWGDVMVIMTPTLINNLSRYENKLTEYKILIFDECHGITSKTNKRVITKLYETVIRVGLSATPFEHKDKTKNRDVMAFFGDITFKITSEELTEQGFSSPIIIKMVPGSKGIKVKGNYKQEYDEAIVNNPLRYVYLLWRVQWNAQRGYLPLMVVAKYHKHVELIYKILKQSLLDKDYKIEYIHHKIKDRDNKLMDFKEGRIDILVASLIIKVGQNMPLMKCMINAASGDSAIQAIQLLGRAQRLHKSKKKTRYEDFYDQGFYLERHSKHRIKYYKGRNFKIIYTPDIKPEDYEYIRELVNTIIN